MPTLINSNPYTDTPAYKIEKACEEIIRIFIEAEADETSSLSEDECENALECVRTIIDSRSKL